MKDKNPFFFFLKDFILVNNPLPTSKLPQNGTETTDLVLFTIRAQEHRKSIF